jgi:hypothetical protein
MIKNKMKNLGYVAAATLLPVTSALATDPKAIDKIGSDIAKVVFTDASLINMGAIMTAIGTVIVIWKIGQMVFGGKEWAEEVKIIMGGLLLMIVGTNFKAIFKMVMPGIT